MNVVKLDEHYNKCSYVKTKISVGLHSSAVCPPFLPKVQTFKLDSLVALTFLNGSVFNLPPHKSFEKRSSDAIPATTTRTCLSFFITQFFETVVRVRGYCKDSTSFTIF